MIHVEIIKKMFVSDVSLVMIIYGIMKQLLVLIICSSPIQNPGKFLNVLKAALCYQIYHRHQAF